MSYDKEEFAKFVYEDLREKWKHEDELVHQRTTRLLTSQAFFLGAHGVLVSLRLQTGFKEAIASHTILLPFGSLTLNPFTLASFFLPAIGLTICRDTRLGVYAAFDALSSIKMTYETRRRDIPELIKFPSVDVAVRHSEGGIRATQNVPNAFLGGGILISFYEILRLVSVK